MRTRLLTSVFFLSCVAVLPVQLHADGSYSSTIFESDLSLPGDVRIELDVASPQWPDRSDYGSDTEDEMEVSVIMRFAF